MQISGQDVSVLGGVADVGGQALAEDGFLAARQPAGEEGKHLGELGRITEVEAYLGQLFHARPAAGYADLRTPVCGLCQAGSATHGGASLASGRNVVRQILAGRRAERWRRRILRPPRAWRAAEGLAGGGCLGGGGGQVQHGQRHGARPEGKLAHAMSEQPGKTRAS